MIRSLGPLVAAACFLVATPAFAQGSGQDGGSDDLTIAIGGGVQILPRYPGADNYTIAPMAAGFVRHDGDPIPFRGPDDGFGFSLTGRGGVIELGPLVEFQAKREEEDAGRAIGDVPFTIEAGVFVNLNLTNAIRARAEIRRGIGGHDSFLGDFGFDLAARSGTETIFTVGPRIRVADEDYMRRYYGVTPAVSAVTGLAPYQPDGGLRAVGVIASVTHQLSPSFGLYGYAGYDRLVGDAANSPIVTTLGSRSQFSGGLALYYSFRMRNPFR